MSGERFPSQSLRPLGREKRFVMPLTLIDQYEVMYSANSFVPRIWLKNSGNYIGQLIFEPDGSALPLDTNVNGEINLFYHLEDFQNAIDLLRDESPMYLLFNGSGGGNENGIKSTPEAVGEPFAKAA
jgi:hypothetical protein